MKHWKWLAVIAMALAVLLIVKRPRPWRHPEASRPAKSITASTPAISAKPSPHAAPTAHALESVKTRAHDMPNGTNAADLYKDAFVLYDALTDEEKKMIAHPKDEVEEAEADELFKKIAPIMELVRQAAGADYCDWGTGPLDASTPMPFLSKAMEIGKVALWASAYEFPKNPGAAVADLTARAQIGRSMPSSMIGRAVNSGMKTGGLDLLSQYLTRLPQETFANVARLTDAKTDEAEFQNAMEGEAEFVKNSFNVLMKPENRGLLADQSHDAPDSLSGMFENDGAGLKAQLQQAANVDREFKDALSWTDARFQAWLAGVAQRSTGQTLVEQSTSMLAAVYRNARTVQIKNQMVAAALAISQNGAAQLGAYRDPATDAPLVYAETADGFTLSSTFLQKGKPVSMTFPW